MQESSSQTLQVTKPSQDQAKIILIPPPQQTITPADVHYNSQSLSSALTVISANIEDLSTVRAFMLSDLCKEQHCHCLCLQETHRDARKVRPRFPGMTLVAERTHDKYGSVIFIKDDLKVKSISVTAAKYTVVIKAELPDVVCTRCL